VYYQVTPGEVTVAEKFVDGKHAATVKNRDYSGNLILAFRTDVEENSSHTVSVSTCLKDDAWWHHVRGPEKQISVAYYHTNGNPSAVAGAKVQLSFHDITEWYLSHEHLSRQLRRQNTVVTSIHAPCIDVCDRGFLEMLEMAKHAYGARFVTVHPQRRDIAKVRSSLSQLQPVLESLDMVLCFENMQPNKKLSRQRWFENLDEFEERTAGLANVGLTFDVVHANGLDEQLFCRHAGRIHVVHLSDRRGDRLHIPIGTGALRTDYMLSVLQQEFKGELVLDYKAEHIEQALQDQKRLQKTFE
jgi:sugar phosphate isomerase/epimerase